MKCQDTIFSLKLQKLYSLISVTRSIGETNLACAAVLAGMLSGSSSEQQGVCGHLWGCALGLSVSGIFAVGRWNRVCAC